MKALLFGGSFDPPHRGHAALLSAAAQRVRPERLIVIPAYKAPLKTGHCAPAAERLRMVRLGLLPSLPKPWRRIAEIDTRELRGRRRVYTIANITRIRAEHPDWELHFVVGSDSAADWDKWRAWQRLPQLCRWWTALRPGTQERRIPEHFTIIRHPMPQISSTDLRADLAAGLECSRWLHPRVAAHIAHRGLYGSGLVAALASGMKPQLFSHSLAVRRLAETLARRWGEDTRRAAWAGLLHDCGRLVPTRRLAAYARTHHLAVPRLGEVVRFQPGLLHAYVGADLARRRLGCRDHEVLRAVRRHTLGAPGMTRLDLIIYVADAVSEDRRHPEAGRLRRLAFRDLGACFADCLSSKLRHALERGAWLHPLSVSLWNFLRKPR